MGEIGFILQEARLKKGFTLDKVADDTNISVRFLAKLENDDFTGFPGEPYIVGFLRNYAEFLGLDPEEVVGTYKSQSTKALPSSSENIPTEDPIPPVAAKEPRKLPLAGLVAILILGAALLWVLFGKGLALGKQEEATSAPAVYRVEGSPFEKRLYPGDSLLIPLGEEVHRVSLSKIEESIELETPSGFLSLSLGESKPLGTEVSQANLVNLTAIDFKQSAPKAGALLRVDFASSDVQAPETSEVTIPPSPVSMDESANAAAAAIKATDIVIFRSPRGPHPFVAQVNFRANSLFRHEADRKEWVEKYYSKGESLSVNVSSSLTIWSSNAQAVKLSFQASGAKPFDLELGGPGEVAVKRISWLRSEGSWVLAATSLD
jgi:cytoskeletal protein RodZ